MKDYKFKWENQYYYSKENGFIRGRVADQNGIWYAYVNEDLKGRYISEKTAKACVERVVCRDEATFANMMKQIKILEKKEEKWWRFWK